MFENNIFRKIELLFEAGVITVHTCNFLTTESEYLTKISSFRSNTIYLPISLLLEIIVVK